jgi:hypothetical protein
MAEERPGPKMAYILMAGYYSDASNIAVYHDKAVAEHMAETVGGYVDEVPLWEPSHPPVHGLMYQAGVRLQGPISQHNTASYIFVYFSTEVIVPYSPEPDFEPVAEQRWEPLGVAVERYLQYRVSSAHLIDRMVVLGEINGYDPQVVAFTLQAKLHTIIETLRANDPALLWEQPIKTGGHWGDTPIPLLSAESNPETAL